MNVIKSGIVLLALFVMAMWVPLNVYGAPPKVKCDVPELTVSVIEAKRVGKNVCVEVVFINEGEKSKKASFVGKEPCVGFDDYVTAAWDTDGEVYEMERGAIAAFKGEDRLYGSFNMPEGVPVKVRLMIYNVPESVTRFPMLSMAFRDLMPFTSYGQALIKARNVPISE